MCGICGVVYSDRDRQVDPDMLRQMTDILSHRGPDSNGFYRSPGIGLGIRRLSIIDLQTGDQPISNEDGTVTIVCNGEIYNFHELRKELLSKGHRFKTSTDVEVITHLYEEYDVHCVDHLRGMFAFALWDERKQRLMLARDRIGIKPLHYSAVPQGIFFGSESKSILMSGQIERQLDITALNDLFEVGMVLAPKTLFTRIRHLRPGHFLLYQKGKLSIHQYWDFNFTSSDEANVRSPEEWAEALRAKLEESVRIHLLSDVPVGAWLSAGIDSSSVVQLMSGISKEAVQTFTLAFENPEFDEVRRSKILTDYAPNNNLSNQKTLCSIEHFKLLPKAIWHCEDPFTRAVGIPLMVLSEQAAKKVKVVLDGEGSDELFGGYPWYRMFKMLQPLMKLPRPLRRIIARVPGLKQKWPRTTRIFKAPDADLNYEAYKKFLDHTNAEFDDRIFSEEIRQEMLGGNHPQEALALPQDFERWEPFAQLQYLEMKVRLSDYITRNLDATSMAYSLEVRVPFLDHELVEFCSKIPADLKMHRFEEKHILRQAMKNLLPLEIVRRKKRGLAAPYAEWVRVLPEFAQDLLSDKTIRDKGYFNPVSVRQMLQQHQNGQANFSPQLMGVLGIHLWDQHFIHGCHQQSF